jgi:hypothetical protein
VILGTHVAGRSDRAPTPRAAARLWR